MHSRERWYKAIYIPRSHINDGTESDTDPEPEGTFRAPAAQNAQGKADSKRRIPMLSKDHLGFSTSRVLAENPDSEGQAPTASIYATTASL
jgi:hypothetical protein